jgi:hypothetical protein
VSWKLRQPADLGKVVFPARGDVAERATKQVILCLRLLASRASKQAKEQTMTAHSGSGFSHAAFTPDELVLLGLFHAGVRARVLRGRYGIDPWAVVRRHRQLPREEFAQLRALAERAAAHAYGRSA